MTSIFRKSLISALRTLIVCGAIVALYNSAVAQSVDEYADKRKKVALTIGINKYASERPLRNPLRDAAAVDSRLKEVGFETLHVENVTAAQGRAASAQFLMRAKDSDIALIYYSGHGLQINGENYIVPSDFSLSKKDIVGQLISVSKLLEDLNSIAKAKVILLDACRNNPFLGAVAAKDKTKSITRGLAPVSVEMPSSQPTNAAYGLIVGFATQPDNTADDGDGNLSPYATGLLQATVFPDEDLSAILVKAARAVLDLTKGAQRPEHRVALTQPLYLVARAKPLLCDVLAAETDNNISVKGVEFDQIDVPAALKACRGDLERQPNNPRLMHNLARALDKGGQKAEAVALYKRAAELGFDWAQNNLAVMYLNGEGTEPNFAEAMIWMRKAYAQGNRQAAVNYAGTDMTRIFEKNSERVTYLQQALSRAGFFTTAPNGKLDNSTRDALSRFKASKSLRGLGITFQDMDELEITSQVLHRK